MKSFLTLFSESLAVYRKHFLQFFLLGILTYFIPLLVTDILKTHIFRFLEFSSIHSKYLFHAGARQLETALVGALFTVTIVQAYLKDEGVKRVFSLDYYYRALVLGLLMMVVFTFAFSFFIIPGIIVVVYWSFSMYALVTDDLSVLASIRQSMSVVNHRWWKVFSYHLTLILIVSVIPAAIALSLHTQGYYLLIPLLVVTMPLTYIFHEKFYMDLKKVIP